MSFEKKNDLTAEATSYAVGFAVRWRTFQYVRMSFCPENVIIWFYSPQNESELSPRSVQSCFPLLQGSSCRKYRQHFFDLPWVKYDYNRRSRLQKTFFSSCFFDSMDGCNRIWPSWIEKVLTVLSCTLLPEKQETAPDRSWRKLWLILRRGRPIFCPPRLNHCW